MKRFFIVLILIITTVNGRATEAATGSATSTQKKEKAPSREEILKRSSFEDIQGAANYLLTVVEAAQAAGGRKNKVLPCDPKSETAQNWLSGPIHSLADAKRDQESEKYVKSPAEYLQPIARCLETCSCNAYSEMLDSVAEKFKERGNEIHQKNVKTAQKQAELENTEKSHFCARNFKKFCGGLIEKYLKAEY